MTRPLNRTLMKAGLITAVLAQLLVQKLGQLLL